MDFLTLPLLHAPTLLYFIRQASYHYLQETDRDGGTENQESLQASYCGCSDENCCPPHVPDARSAKDYLHTRPRPTGKNWAN